LLDFLYEFAKEFQSFSHETVADNKTLCTVSD